MESNLTTPLPPRFLEYISRYPMLAPLADTLANTEPSVTVRVNRRKGVQVPDGADRVAWNNDAFYLEERPRFTFDPALHQGLYYVQDASSSVIATVIGRLLERMDDEPKTYLDACAAPGGKTTAAIDALPDGSTVFANEFDPKRVGGLIENIRRWGSPDVVITRGDTAQYRRIGATFDIIGADVPCSGEGMFRKEPQAVEQWSPALTEQCAALQREIVENVWDALKPGGYLIYSTCTFNRAENEENVKWIIDTLGARPIDLNLSDFAKDGVSAGLDTDIPCARFIPGRVRGEGLFIAVLQRPDDGEVSVSHGSSKKSQKRVVKAAPELDAVRPWLRGTPALTLEGDTITATSERTRQIADRVSAKLSVVSVGTPVATVKTGGSDAKKPNDKGRGARDSRPVKRPIVTPEHTLVTSTLLADDAFPRVEVDYATAIDYLRRQTPQGYPDQPQGYLLLTYRARPLGLIKNLGARANTLLPPSTRILSASIPTTPITIL